MRVVKLLNHRVTFLIFVFILIFLSFVPRSVELINKNYLFLFDQGRDYLAVKNIVVDHKHTLIGAEIGGGSAGFSYIFHGPGFYYLLAFPFWLSGGDPYSGIVLMWLFAIGAIALSVFVGKKIFGSTLNGVLLALLVASAPSLISHARFTWNPHPSPLFIILLFYFVYLAAKRSLFLFFAALTAGFLYNFDLAIAVPLSITLLIYTVFVLRLRAMKQYFLLLLGSFLGYFPMFLFEARHGFQGTKNMVAYFVSHPGKQAHLSSSDMFYGHLQSFINNFSSAFSTYNYIAWFWVALIIIIPLIFFIRHERDKKIKYFITFLLLLLPITFLIFMPLRNVVWDHFLIHVTLSYIFLLAYVLSHVLQRQKFALAGFFVFFIFIVFGFVNAITTWNHDYNDFGGRSKIKGKTAALDYIYKNAKGEKFGLLVFDPSVYTYAYDYLSWWYGRKVYRYDPHKEKRGLVYLLMEQDPSKPWSYKGWLETVIKIGTVVETKELPDGLIIQKRVIK